MSVRKYSVTVKPSVLSGLEEFNPFAITRAESPWGQNGNPRNFQRFNQNPFGYSPVHQSVNKPPTGARITQGSVDTDSSSEGTRNGNLLPVWVRKQIYLHVWTHLCMAWILRKFLQGEANIPSLSAALVPPEKSWEKVSKEIKVFSTS